MIPSPPVLKDIPYGVELIAGHGKSQIIADLDFETYSEAGFIWNPSTNKYVSPLGPMKEKGLSVVGTAVYAQHPSTEVICMAYDLKDGKGRRLWVPGEGLTPLADLFAHLAKGKLIEAWNCSFERWIWHYVCVPKYGFPELPFFALRDAAAKALAYGLPPSLGPAALALNTMQKKDTEGKRLIQKFSIPRNPTKTNQSRRNTAVDFPLDILSMYAYCVQDIITEAELSSKIPDLNLFESEFWACDQLINWRGVQVDMATVDACLSIIEENKLQLETELRQITNGVVLSATKLMDLKKWLATRGYFPDSLDVDAVAALLGNPLLPPDVKRVLKIRESLASSSVKKINTIKLQASAQGRLHNLFVYHGARTGRAAGRGVQPQNLPNSGIAVTKCHCRPTPRYVGVVCQWCVDETKPTQWEEWSAEAMQDAIADINTLSYHQLCERWGDPVALISGCIRGLLTAKEGHDLICSDYSAIEAVVLAALAGEEWRLDVFKTHGLIYESSASKITGIPFDDYIKHKKETGTHHPTRKTIGKVAELACFSHDTQVLTSLGYVAIMDVTLQHQLWDGEKWVKHSGIIVKGKRNVINLDGIEVTPNHPISLGHSWQEAKLLASNENMLTQALANASVNLPILESSGDAAKEAGWRNASVHAVNLLVRLILILDPEGQLDAIDALRKLQKLPVLNGSKRTPATDILYRVLNIDDDWEIVYQRLLVVVTMLKILPTQITEDAALKFAMLGAEKSMNFLRILLQFPDGVTKCLKWIEWIVQGITNPVTSGLLLDQITNSINEKSKNYKKESTNLKSVYDIVNAGDLNRFTIRTDSGHLLVHNSGYAGWIGAWKNFGADAYFTDDEIKKHILAWRAASPNIVNFWGGQYQYRNPQLHGLEGCAIQAVATPGRQFTYRDITYICLRDVLYCVLPSGRHIAYHRPLLRSSSRPSFYGPSVELSFEGWNTNPKNGVIGWVRMNTYGGRLTENVVQAVARDILAYAIVNLEKAGYPVVLHVHDEIVAEVPEGFGSVEEFEKIMSTMPAWAESWPLKAKGGWRSKRYGK